MAVADSAAGGGFEQYTQEVYGWAYRLLGRHHDALDVVQDVFLKWDAQCERSSPKQPRGWLRRVTVNRAIDLQRRRRFDQGEPAGLAEASARADAGVDAEIRLDHGALRDDVGVALDGLSDAQRSVLVAKVYDEMTFAQIAGELGLAVSTVKTHYLRALRAVRDRLATRWAEEEKTS